MKNSRELIINELSEKLFDIKRWPHYKLMFNHLNNLLTEINDKDNLAILERCYIYGGLSIFSSLFEGKKVEIFDFIPPNSSEKIRKNYQKDRLKDLPLTSNKIKEANNEVSYIDLNKSLNTNGPFDYIFIPNVLHHHPNPFKLFKDCKSGLKEKGFLYIFDAILRESHQKPDDFIRFTPDGINFALEENGFAIKNIYTSKSPVEALLYTLDQVVQYDLPSNLLLEINRMIKLIQNEHKETLYKDYKNLFRGYTSFPVAYSVLAQKK
tara:strand:+ start:329 stop:1126 length:798 start_codon:yes stop_codon:yes gene_type:complete